MKKIASLIIAAIMVLGMTSCDLDFSSDTAETTTTSAVIQSGDSSAEANEVKTEKQTTPRDHKTFNPFNTIPTFKLVLRILTPIIYLTAGINLIKGNPHPKANEAKLKAFELVGAFQKDSKLVKKFPKQNAIE
jgi:hypothetical protein